MNEPTNSSQPYSLDTLSIEDICLRLRSIQPSKADNDLRLSEDSLKKAAVLVPFVRINESWHLLFIRRAEHEHDHHSGQVAFPGGKPEIGDSDLRETALRETSEELGIANEDVNVLGIIASHFTASNFVIYPYVGLVPWPYDVNPNPDEVAHYFTIPLSWLADSSHHRYEEFRGSGLSQGIQVVYFDSYDGELLWGATAKMVLTLVNALQDSPSVSSAV